MNWKAKKGKKEEEEKKKMTMGPWESKRPATTFSVFLSLFF